MSVVLGGVASAGTNALSVSVVVPTYNRAGMLAACVESLLRQTQAPLEIIVVDDGSTDQTAAVARSFPPGVRYFSKRNEGKATALNYVLPHVRGEWVWFFDDDDVALPRSIELRLAALNRAPEAGIVISRFLWGSSDPSGRVISGEPLQWPTFTSADFYPKFLRACFAHLNGALIRRSRIDELGGFRTDLLTSEDYEFTLRIARGVHVAICDEPTFIFRQHQGARGPQAQRYAASERLRKFADGDAEVGRWIRSSHELNEFLGLLPEQELDETLTRQALLARLQVMAGKGLLAEVAEDSLALATAFDDAGLELDPSTGEGLKSAFQERYLAFRMVEAPDAVIRLMTPLNTSSVGRWILRIGARAILGRARWPGVRAAEKARLAFLAIRLAWLSLR